MPRRTGDIRRRPRPAAAASFLRLPASLSRLCRGGQNTSTSRQWLSVVHAPCGTHDGTTATSPLRIVRTSPSRSKMNSPSSTMTICSSSCTCRGASAPGSKLTKFVIALLPSTGRNPSPGRNSTGFSVSTFTYRPGRRRLALRLRREVALGVAKRLSGRPVNLTHRSSSAVWSTSPIRRTPSSMSSSATRL